MAVAVVATPHGKDTHRLAVVAQVVKWSVAMALIGANTPSRSERVAVKLWQVAALLSVAL
ncbi:hypothetical protein LINBF2_13110 [Limnohabitans sp. INBF002]|nr:hypothetical protein LINBF2_13110 [Limnohabitans sp. INBF002]